jgi:hypothetical protein
MTVFSFDPKQVTLVIGGFLIGGFADDDFISIKRDQDGWAKKVGVSGEIGRVQNLDISGSITIRLLQSSESNDALSTLAALDESQGIAATYSLCRDKNGRSVFASPFVWVKKYPDVQYKKDVAILEWVLDTAQLLIYVGGLNA